MNSSNPKISFIPKGPLAGDSSFLERKRPQSVIEVLAILGFIISVGGYAGLYFYDVTLSGQVAAKIQDVKKIQSVFSQSLDVTQAKIFRSRADLAKELLSGHVAVSPVFAFLSENTVASIMYDKFSFTHGADGLQLTLSGEAPTYVALAYQSDRLREKTKDLVSFSVENITLAQFGNIEFVLNMVFSPTYLSYLSTVGEGNNQSASVPAAIPVTPDRENSTSVSVPFNTGDTTIVSGMITDGTSTQSPSVVSSVATIPTTAPSSVLAKSWWEWFKFW